MGTMDEFRTTFAEELAELTETTPDGYHNWHELCVCGHLDRYHSESIGGSYELEETVTRTSPYDSAEWTFSNIFHGCRGAVARAGFEDTTIDRDPVAHTQTTRYLPTCQCPNFRPVARVDRPNRMFNQRIPTERTAIVRHPFNTGIRALTTHLLKRKAALTDSGWAQAEFDRRFRWLPDARMCSVARCRTSSADVWPVFVDGDPAQSELRCSTHR